jgi:hypothetical protein
MHADPYARGLLNPNRPPIGRQPNEAKWTPSKADPWYYGSIRGFEVVRGALVGGERYTVEQQLAMAHHGIPLDTAEFMFVRRQATPQEWSMGYNGERVVFGFDCPILGLTPDERIRVIGPDGKPHTVRQDGWGIAPSRKIVVRY